jgi:hypothetical protein
MAKVSVRVKRILNCIPSRKTDTDWRVSHARAGGALAAAAVIPRAKDLREAWWKIGNQAATGACVGWATADSLLRWQFVKAGRLGKNEPLSPRFIWMASKETDQFVTQPTTFIEVEGTSLKAALDIARKFGAVREPVLPFGQAKLYPEEASTFYALAAQLKIASYFNLNSNFMNWRTWIATKGPVLTRLMVDASATGGNLDVYQPATVRGGHAIALVGYTPDRFIVRNSWGTNWGDQGYGYASLAYAQAAFTEAYGVTV